MNLKAPIILGLSATLLVTACGGGGGGRRNNNAEQGAITGAVVGGLAGAITADEGDDVLGRAIGGAAIGAVVGGVAGTVLDQQASELQRSVGNGITVTNMGGYLVVNMPQDLLFATDSATLAPTLQRDLQAVALNLQKYTDNRVEVVGHTDNTGSAAYNMDLSQRRASAVASSLIGYGVPSVRVRAYGRGEDQPIASNLTEEGRALNRRVEILIYPN